MKKFLLTFLLCFGGCCALLGIAACGGSVSVSGIYLKQNSIELNIGDVYQLEYTITPENATNSNVLFYSSDESIVMVKSDGSVLAVSEGEATVTVKTEDGNYSDLCNITVQGDLNQYENKTEEEQKEEVKDPEESENQEQGGNTEDTENQEDSEEQGDNGEQEDENIPEVVTYKVTFMDGDTIVGICNFTEDNLYIIEPDVPQKDGYTVEWESYTLSLENIVVNAIYMPVQYVITFMAEGIPVGYATFTVESSSIDEPIVPAMAGYEGKWEAYTLICSDFTVDAVYTLINYTITYVNTKGAENLNPVSYNAENRFAFADIIAVGYKFDGWYINGEKITSVNSCYGDITVTANWSLIEYTIIFTDENWDRIIGTVTYTVESTEIILPDVPEKDGYVGSWSKFELNYIESEPVRVYAVYTKIEE